ncbi:hypothetical protein L9F63_025306, partial [Diploptera punctata]
MFEVFNFFKSLENCEENFFKALLTRHQNTSKSLGTIERYVKKREMSADERRDIK